MLIQRFVSLAALVVLAGCSSAEPGRSATKDAPKGPADLCQAIGTELLDRFVPSGTPKAESTDFGLFNEQSCSSYSSLNTVAATRGDLFVALHRHGTDASGRTADQICRAELTGYKQRDSSMWTDVSASALPLLLGDVTEAVARPNQNDFEAEILLCRSADFVRVHYRLTGGDRDGAVAAAEQVARRVLSAVPR